MRRRPVLAEASIRGGTQCAVFDPDATPQTAQPITQGDIRQGQLVAGLGMASVYPAEFVMLRMVQNVCEGDSWVEHSEGRIMNPDRNFRYRLEVDGADEASFSEVAIGELSVDPIDYREGDEITIVRKLAGLTKYANITLRWGITDSTELADWYRIVVHGRARDRHPFRRVVVRVLGDGGEETAAFEVIKAWPCKYLPSDLDAKGSGVAIDTLELCNEGMKRVR